MAYIVIKIAYKVERLSQKLLSSFHFNFVQSILHMLDAYNLVELNNLFETYKCQLESLYIYIYISYIYKYDAYSDI